MLFSEKVIGYYQVPKSIREDDFLFYYQPVQESVNTTAFSHTTLASPVTTVHHATRYFKTGKHGNFTTNGHLKRKT